MQETIFLNKITIIKYWYILYCKEIFVEIVKISIKIKNSYSSIKRTINF